MEGVLSVVISEVHEYIVKMKSEYFVSPLIDKVLVILITFVASIILFYNFHWGTVKILKIIGMLNSCQTIYTH